MRQIQTPTISQNRKHPWSFIPGGASILATKKNGKEVLYDRIKNVEAYLAKCFKRKGITSAWVMDGNGNNYQVFENQIEPKLLKAA